MVMKRPGGLTVAESDLPDDAPVDPVAVLRKLDRHVVPWLFFLGILCYLDRTNLSFAALDLSRDLKLSCSAYGLGASLFFVSYALFQLPSTVICARLGAHVWLAGNMVAWGAVATAFSLVNGVPVFLLLRFLLGATESSAFPGMWYHLSLFYNEAELGPAYAKVASCTAVAQVVGAPLAAALLTMDGTAGLRGWQWIFILEGLLTMVFGVVLRFALPPSPAKARMLTRGEREWLHSRQHGSRGAGAGRHALPREAGGFAQQLRVTLSVVRDWRILYLSACWLLIAAVMFGIVFFMPLLVASMFAGDGGISGSGTAGGHGGSACHSGEGGKAGGGGQEQQHHSSLIVLATAIPFIMGAVGMNINARLAERANERHRHAGVPILLAGAFMGLVPLAARLAGAPLAFALLCAAAGCCWSFHGPFFSWPAVFLTGEQAAAGFALINSLGAVGGFIGPYLLGLLSDRSAYGFGAAMLVLACFLLTSGTLILIFPAPGRREEQELMGLALGSKASDAEEYAPSLEQGELAAAQRLKPIGGGEGALVLEAGSGGGSSDLQRSATVLRHARLKAGSSSSQLSELECQPILTADTSRPG